MIQQIWGNLANVLYGSSALSLYHIKQKKNFTFSDLLAKNILLWRRKETSLNRRLDLEIQ